MKKIICFDLDGTLTESKTDITPGMVDLLAELQKIKKVAVIGGASFKQFQKQFLKYLTYFDNLYILPTSGASFYKFENNKWQNIYQLLLTPTEKKQIFDAFKKTFTEINYQHPTKTYGEIIEDRECEVVFSTLGQKAPLAQRLALKYDRRPEIVNSLQEYLPEFKISISGVNSIDVTREGIDKGYAIEQIEKYFDVTKDEIVFVGDAIY
ncbi:MAG: HAD-IIB family hydrolase, partial [Candidatus Amesbacteria bacterium]|nr:HAD-IIB family hydrolase [Candidatus Amesbacteria bacterium]